jgi:multiple sugar transport system substrate-binding protein
MKPISLRGITWNHSRAFPPLVAAAQRFEEQNENIRILWEKRSLHEFGHADLPTLARSFDLLVLDHPMLGVADRTNILLDLKPMLSRGTLDGLKQDALGPCLDSYWFHEKLYALPIDAAAPAASLRVDLLELEGMTEPDSWSGMLELARRGRVRMPGFPADLFLNFMGLCVSHGSAVAATEDQFLDRAIALRSLEDLRELAGLMPETIYSMNPISLYEAMSAEETIAYCPFAYTYNNYSRQGFGRSRLRFSGPVFVESGRRMRTVLGGTGLAISSNCGERDLALAFCLFVVGRECQSTIYALAGGQPASLTAWHDETLNQITDSFFNRTLSSIQSGYIRPRYNGYIGLQEQGGLPIIKYLRNGGNPGRTVDRIEELYRISVVGGRNDS